MRKMRALRGFYQSTLANVVPMLLARAWLHSSAARGVAAMAAHAARRARR
jgi:hypothetical protein